VTRPGPGIRSVMIEGSARIGAVSTAAVSRHCRRLSSVFQR
jgi:hypothetical protein